MKTLAYLGLLATLLPAYAAAQSTRSVYGIQTVAGSSNMGDGGPATAAQIGNIQGVAADSSGNLYLADTDHNRIRKIDAAGVITTVAGTGVAGFSGDGGPATSAQLNLPYGLAVDLAGNLYIADLNNNRVRRVSPNGTIETYAGMGGNGSSGDGGPATRAQLLLPRNVAVDSAGNLYISEFGAHRVRKVVPSGLISTFAGTGLAGFSGDGGPATAAQLFFPAGLAVDRFGNLYIADSQNDRVREVLGTGQIATVLGGSSASSLITPVAVAVGLSGDVFVADSISVVHEYTAAHSFVSAAGNGTPGFFGDGGPATSAELTNPLALALDLAGSLYIADADRIREVTGAKIYTVAGDNYTNSIGDGGSATAAELNQPNSVALDGSGDLYIADTATNRVRRVSASGTITTVAGNGSAAAGGNGTAATETPLMTPMAVALDPYGNLLIAETGANRIREVAANGTVATIIGTGAAGLGADSLLATQTQLRAPRGLCVSRSGNIYVVDTGNHRVLAAPPGGLVTVAAGNGAAGYSGDGGGAPYAQLNQPSACAVDSAGDLFIADTYNHRIRKVNAGGTIGTVVGDGTAGYGGDGGPAASASLNAPRGVAVDDNGNIYIADTGNNAVRQLTPDGNIHTIGGDGAQGFAGDGGPALSAMLDAPGGILLDGSGDLYFADTGNNRVRMLNPMAPGTTPVTPTPPPLSVVNAAGLSSGPVAPGEIVTIFGAGLGPEAGVGAQLASDGLLANELAFAEVLFDGLPAPLFYVQNSQINVQVPYTVAGNASTQIEVVYQGATVNSITMPVAGSAPGVFAAALNQDGSINSQSNPASTGEYLTIFATGEGLTNGPNISGQPAGAPYPQPLLPVSVTLGGMNAPVFWAGSAPGLVGLLQVNLMLPAASIATGAVPLQLEVGGAISPQMTVWIH